MTWNYELFIDGKWTSEGAEGSIDVIDPATEAVIGSVPEASTKSAVRAIEATRRAFDEGPWPYMKPAERAAKLIAMAEILEAQAGDLRELIVAETGSTGFLTDAVQGAGSIGMLRSNASLVEHSFPWVENGAPTGGPTGSGRQRHRPRAHRRGRGHHAVQLPLHAQHREGGARAGRRLHGRPQAAPLDAARRHVDRRGRRRGRDPARRAQRHHRSRRGGRRAHVQPDGRHGHLHGLDSDRTPDHGVGVGDGEAGPARAGWQECDGGARDVGEDYARSVGFGQVLMHCGQGCVLHTRLLLPERLLDAYKEGLDAMRPMITIGDPRNEGTVLGPLIREQQRERVQGYVASGLEQGAELLCGGKRPEGLDKGYYYEPTVFVSNNDLRIAQEEIFGPVLTVVPYSGEDEDAVRLANDSIYGLGGGVVSTSDSRAFNVARRIRAGLVTVQKVGTEPLAGIGPGGGQGPGWGSEFKGIGQSGAFGGYKQSGLGREWGRHGLEDFTEIKNLAWS